VKSTSIFKLIINLRKEVSMTIKSEFDKHEKKVRKEVKHQLNDDEPTPTPTPVPTPEGETLRDKADHATQNIHDSFAHAGQKVHEGFDHAGESIRHQVQDNNPEPVGDQAPQHEDL
jgi:hypothetical protein